jgi:hypothetical protein
MILACIESDTTVVMLVDVHHSKEYDAGIEREWQLVAWLLLVT